MTKWLLAMLVTVIIVQICLPRLAAWLRLGRLPGDVTLSLGRRSCYLPFGTTLLLSGLAALVWRLL